MGKETVLFKSEEKMSHVQAADLLRTLADKVEKGKVTLTQGTKETRLKIPNRVEVEIKAEKETGKKRVKKKIEVEIEWQVGSQKGTTGPMKIK